MTSDDAGAFATVVIVAAGRGERFGSRAKVLAPVGGKPVLEWSLIAATGARCVRDVIVVAGEHTMPAIADLVHSAIWSKPVSIVQGGVRRQDSVVAGVDAVSPASDVVLIHDAARPLATAGLFEACALEARECGAAILAIPVSDTLKHATGGVIQRTVSREGLWAAQTPQGFRREVIQSAIGRSRTMSEEFTDEASLLEALGQPVRIVPGARSNLKVTHREDLDLVDALLLRRAQMEKERGW